MTPVMEAGDPREVACMSPRIPFVCTAIGIVLEVVVEDPLTLRVKVGLGPNADMLLPLTPRIVVSGLEFSPSAVMSDASSSTIVSSEAAPSLELPLGCPEVALFRPVGPGAAVLDATRLLVFPVRLGLYALITNSGILGADGVAVDAKSLDDAALSALFDEGSNPHEIDCQWTFLQCSEQ